LESELDQVARGEFDFTRMRHLLLPRTDAEDDEGEWRFGGSHEVSTRRRRNVTFLALMVSCVEIFRDKIIAGML
jgi:hypothetical protein